MCCFVLMSDTVRTEPSVSSKIDAPVIMHAMATAVIDGRLNLRIWQ